MPDTIVAYLPARMPDAIVAYLPARMPDTIAAYLPAWTPDADHRASPDPDDRFYADFTQISHPLYIPVTFG